jgi:hypothetical protein
MPGMRRGAWLNLVFRRPRQLALALGKPPAQRSDAYLSTKAHGSSYMSRGAYTTPRAPPVCVAPRCPLGHHTRDVRPRTPALKVVALTSEFTDADASLMHGS